MTWTTTNILKSKMRFPGCSEYNKFLTSKSNYLHDHECALGIWRKINVIFKLYNDKIKLLQNQKENKAT